MHIITVTAVVTIDGDSVDGETVRKSAEVATEAHPYRIAHGMLHLLADEFLPGVPTRRVGTPGR